MAKENKKTITISFAPVTQDQIANLKEKLGMFSDNEVVRYCISYTHEQTMPKAYAQAKLVSATRSARTPEEKAIEQEEIESAKIKAKEQKIIDDQKEAEENGAMLCRQLFGEETKDNNGNRKCVYNSYGFTNPQNATKTERIKYLDELTDDDVENQYYSTITNEPMPADQVMEAVKETDRLLALSAKPKPAKK